MPQLTIQYTRNIGEKARIPQLLQALCDVLVGQGVFATKAIRARAIPLDDYRIGDGSLPDAAFLYVELLILPGRAEAVKVKVRADLLEALKGHFAGYMAERHLGMTLYVHEFGPEGIARHDNFDATF